LQKTLKGVTNIKKGMCWEDLHKNDLAATLGMTDPQCEAQLKGKRTKSDPSVRWMPLSGKQHAVCPSDKGVQGIQTESRKKAKSCGDKGPILNGIGGTSRTETFPCRPRKKVRGGLNLRVCPVKRSAERGKSQLERENAAGIYKGDRKHIGNHTERLKGKKCAGSSRLGGSTLGGKKYPRH